MTLIEQLQKDVQAFMSQKSDTAPLLKRVFLFFEDSEFDQADAYCEKILDMEPENPFAYLGKLMASRRMQTVQELALCDEIIRNEGAFKKALRFAQGELKAHLQALDLQVYANAIASTRKKIRNRLNHNDLKEAAQLYQNTIAYWEQCGGQIPDGPAVYAQLQSEIADFNWKLLLYNRQCPDETQLVERSIPLNTDRWYLSALKWANGEQKAHFEAVAKEVLFHAHLKCMDAIATGNTKLASIWTDHYQANASSDDPLCHIHSVLLATDGYTRFHRDAVATLLQLAEFYTKAYPQGVSNVKQALKDYYPRIFEDLLDFADSEDSQRAALDITGQMVHAIPSDHSPYGLVTTYLMAAKHLTVRYGKSEAIATSASLFDFVCEYYENALSAAQPEQAEVIRGKFNDFLTDVVRLDASTAEIAATASSHMGGSNLPYQIYLSRLTHNYTVEKEQLIPQALTEDLAKWREQITASNPKRDCYWISSQKELVCNTFTHGQNAVTACREYSDTLQDSLNGPYQAVIEYAGEGGDELAANWETKMHDLEVLCADWADRLEADISEIRAVYEDKLKIADKQIRKNAAGQFIGLLVQNAAQLFTVLTLALLLVPVVGLGWSTMQGLGSALRQSNAAWLHPVVIGVSMLTAVLSLVLFCVLPSLWKPGRKKGRWLFVPVMAIVYVLMGGVANLIYTDSSISALLESIYPNAVYAGILVILGIGRTVLELNWGRRLEHSLSNPARVASIVGQVITRVCQLAQALVCFFIAGMFIFSLIAG